jgi:hypothetical protein
MNQQRLARFRGVAYIAVGIIIVIAYVISRLRH